MTWSTSTVHRASGATQRMLDYWIRLGLFSSSLADLGHGYRRRWEDYQVILARALVLMASIMPVTGYTRLRGVEDHVRRAWEWEPTLRDVWLVITPTSVGVYYGLSLGATTHAAIVIDLGACADHVRAERELARR